MGSNVDNEKVLIKNRKRKYKVFKRDLSTVPYFEKMFASDCSESKEKKVKLDFDEKAFNAIIQWILSGSFNMEMDYVIKFYEIADYLLINERLLDACRSYFHENLTIEHIPVVLRQATKVSQILTSGVSSMICRYFLIIANTDIFLDYPVETVEAILKLDLVVHSEYQIFESIMKWVDKDEKSRKAFLPQLLNCVRWNYMDPDDISKIKDNELTKALPNFDAITSANDETGFNRNKQIFFVSVLQEDATTLKIKALDDDIFCFAVSDFIQDDSMSLEFVHGEHISDILFDSGTKGVRIDWIKKTFRWLDFKGKVKTYYSHLFKFIVKFSSNGSHLWCYLEDEDEDLSGTICSEEQVLLEANGEFILIGKTKTDKEWFGLFPVKGSSWFHDFKDHKHSFQATVLENVVYILTKDLQFIQFNFETKCFDESEPFEEEKWNFNDLILTSHQTNDDKVILVNKSSGKVYFFCINQKKWIEKFRIMNVNSCSNSSGSSKLVAFSTTFLPMKFIDTLYETSEDSISNI